MILNDKLCSLTETSQSTVQCRDVLPGQCLFYGGCAALLDTMNNACFPPLPKDPSFCQLSKVPLIIFKQLAQVSSFLQKQLHQSCPL